MGREQRVGGKIHEPLTLQKETGTFSNARFAKVVSCIGLGETRSTKMSFNAAAARRNSVSPPLNMKLQRGVLLINYLLRASRRDEWLIAVFFAWLVIIGSGYAASAGEVSASSAAMPLIVIDRWWDVDFAKEGCWPGMTNKAACEHQMMTEYSSFEREVKTEFAATEECAGIKVTSFGYPQGSAAVKEDLTGKPFWDFSINYHQGKASQEWQMTPPKGKEFSMMQVMQGKGTPPQIANQVCAIIKGKGAEIR